MRGLHKDALQRYIQMDDYVVWAASRQGYGLQVGRVVGMAKKQIHIVLIGSNEKRRLFPKNCIIITAQVHQNAYDGVGAQDREPVMGTREFTAGRQSLAGQTMESWLTARGISMDEVTGDDQ